MQATKKTGPTIGILGGSFNPPHIAHVLACQYALCRWPLDAIVVIPSFIHPFDKELESYSHRFEMTRLAFASLSPHAEVSRIEEEMGGVSFTIDTIRELKKRMPKAALRLIVGSDIVPEMDKWKDIESIHREASPLIIPRLDESVDLKAGFGGYFLPDISSTQIREQLRDGKDAAAAIPWQVMDYIRRNGLYRIPNSA